MHTSTGAAARLALPPGRHLARLVTNLDRLHALDLRSNTPFQMDDVNTVRNPTLFAANMTLQLAAAAALPLGRADVQLA